jgi:hypothetical protein
MLVLTKKSKRQLLLKYLSFQVSFRKVVINLAAQIGIGSDRLCTTVGLNVSSRREETYPLPNPTKRTLAAAQQLIQ